MPLTPVNFPRISQILVSRRHLVELIRDNFNNEVGAGPILIISGSHATRAYAEIYKGLIKEVWRIEPIHRVLEEAPSLSEAMVLAGQTNGLPLEDRPRLVVYVGGQTVGDATKVIVHEMRRKLEEEQSDRGVVFGGIITSLSNDGVFSLTASVRDENGLPMSLPAEAPDFVVGHGLTLLRQPYVMKISCVGDILAKISSLWDYNYSCRVLEKYHNDFAAHLTVSAYEVPLRTPNMNRHYLHNPDSIDVLYRAVQLCGLSMQLARSSETCSGSEHVGQKWLEEYIARYNAHGGIPSRIPVLWHGEAVTPTTIVTLYLQGQAKMAEEVKGIAREVGLQFRVSDLKISGRVLQVCLALGLGFRCPKYLAHTLTGTALPKGDPNERVTILEEIEARVLTEAIRAAMIDSEVASEDDFGELVGIERVVMDEVFESAMNHLDNIVRRALGEEEAAGAKAAEIVQELRILFDELLPQGATGRAMAHH